MNLFPVSRAVFFLLLTAAFAASQRASAAPTFREVHAAYVESDAWLLARDGRPLQSKRIDMKARRLPWTRIEDVSPALLRALLVSEDRQFYEHSGVDWGAVAVSAWRNLWNTRTRGASTLTMQLVGLLDEYSAAPDDPRKPKASRRNVTEKISQAASALWLEKRWKKDEILEAYLNLAGFRGEMVGVAAMSRGLFGKRPDPAYIEKVLRDLSLWEKRDNPIITLSGGMKRRLLIAKALSHEPKILFLDEPTAGVDVSLRRDMWQLVRRLRDSGVTIILTTHYIEEAEEMADRVAVINKGEIILVEEKDELMRKLGKKQLTLQLDPLLDRLPPSLGGRALELSPDGRQLTYTYEAKDEESGIVPLLEDINRAGIRFHDLQTSQRSLEDIFVSLVKENA